MGSGEFGVLVVSNLCPQLVHLGFWTAGFKLKYFGP